MKILVTGAAGFIGSHFAEKLARLGHDVVGVDSLTDYYDVRLKEINVRHIKDAGVSFYKIDIVPGNLSEIVLGVDFIYHFAAQPGISDKVKFDSYERNNLLATYKLLESVRNSKTLKCFVYISTSSVYGAYAVGDEGVPPAPTSYYGVTKLASEQLVLAYCRDKGVPSCSVRLFSVYGERERPEKLYPKLIKSILENKEFPLYEGSENHKRSYTYVGDIVEGLAKIIDRYESCVGQIFNLGTETSITTGEGIRIIEEVLGKKANIVSVSKRAGDQKETSAKIDKARSILGYEPSTKAKEGLRREVEWYQKEIHDKL